MADTLTEEGTVVAVVGDECVVQLRPTDESRCRKCGLCAEAAEDAEKRRTLRLPLAGQVRVGSIVRVEIRRPNPSIVALVLFGIPTVAFAGGAAIGVLIADLLNWAGWVGALAGVCVAAPVAMVIIKRIENRLAARGALSATIVAGRDAAGGGAADSPAGDGKRRPGGGKANGWENDVPQR